MNLTVFEIGKPFPWPVPWQEGPVMEIDGNGNWYLLLQYPALTPTKKTAFQEKLQNYGYLETGPPIPIALWSFEYPAPLNVVDCSFNARIADPGGIEKFLEPSGQEDNELKTALQVFLLDGPILKGIKCLGLHPDAVRSFHGTIRKQLETPYPSQEFVRKLNLLYRNSPRELLEKVPFSP